MEIIKLILYIYLGVGAVYALYIYFGSKGKFLHIPINILGGPIAIIQALISAGRDSKKFEHPEL